MLGGGGGSIPQTLDQLLERQWEQGSQFLMEQAQHFDSKLFAFKNRSYPITTLYMFFSMSPQFDPCGTSESNSIFLSIFMVNIFLSVETLLEGIINQ